MTQAVTSYLRRVPPMKLGVSARITALSRTGLTRTPSTILFRHTYQMRRRHSLATRTTTSMQSQAPLILRWRRQMTRLPFLSQTTRPITFIVVTCNWWSSFHVHSYELCLFRRDVCHLLCSSYVFYIYPVRVLGSGNLHFFFCPQSNSTSSHVCAS